jgi:hypothetical protein
MLVPVLVLINNLDHNQPLILWAASVDRMHPQRKQPFADVIVCRRPFGAPTSALFGMLYCSTCNNNHRHTGAGQSGAVLVPAQRVTIAGWIRGCDPRAAKMDAEASLCLTNSLKSPPFSAC